MLRKDQNILDYEKKIYFLNLVRFVANTYVDRHRQVDCPTYLPDGPALPLEDCLLNLSDGPALLNEDA